MSGPCHEIVDDIEDLISSQDITPKERYSFRRKKLTDSKRRKQEDLIIPEAQIYSSIIPGTQAIYIKTWGCTHNSSDGEYMAGQLAAYGYNLTDNKYIANLWLLNSCTVKGPAEDHFRNEIEAGKKLGKHIVAAGCVPQGAPKSTFIQGLSVIGVNQIDRIVEVVEETLKGNTVRFLKKQREGKKIEVPLFLPKIRRNPLIEIIAINTGCLNQCTYCKTKHARGELGSYNPKDIVERATQAFEEGVCEIWITSEDTGAYGRDIGTNLPELLWKLIEVVPDGCRLRVGMTNPPYILEHLEEISQILQHPKVYSFLHIPVQCGSDKVLFDMKREYTRLDFEHIVNFLRTRIPKINIATDIICGFPSETDQDFQETVDLCKKYKFSSLFINQFFPRPGTPAALMTQIPKQEIKKRTKILSDFFQSYEPYSKKVGEIQNILVTEVAHDKKHYVGHNCYYEQVLVPKNKEFLGKIIKVKIMSASKHSLRGEPLPEENVKTVPQEKVFSKLLSIVVLHKLQLSALVIITVAIIVKVFWKFFIKF